MLNEGSAPVLIAIADRARRQETAQTLRAAGFEVWEALDYDEAVTLLHASRRALVMLVDRELVSVLDFAADDRRLAHQHIYVALDSEVGPRTKETCEQFPCLTVWRLTSPTPQELTQTVMRATRLLGAVAAGRHDLAAH